MTQNRPHVVGIDPGNSSAKVVASMSNGTEHKYVVPNVSALAEELDVPPVSMHPLDRIDLEILNPAPGYDGERFIGKLAVKQCSQDIKQDRKRNKANSDNINLITPAVLAMLCQDGDQVVLGIGSPFADFQSQRPKIVERLQRVFRIRFGKYAGSRAGQTIEFEVISVSPYPQTAGGYIDQAMGPIGLSHPEWARENVVTIDLGLGQTGFAYFSEGEPAKPGCFSVDEAFIRAARGVQQFISSAHYVDYTIPEILNVIERGKIVLENEHIDMTPMVEIELGQLVSALQKRYDEKMPAKLKGEANPILLIGGGSLAPGAVDIFQEHFRLPVVVGHDPRYSNARGFREHALKKYEKHEREMANVGAR